jgi:hypothetical protein
MTICKRTGFECDRMCMDFCNIAEERIVKLETALRSIAANTCCDRCQEAALVARQALGEITRIPEGN